MSGVKHDQDKTRLDLLPPELLLAVGDILTSGAKKYAERNWEKGMDWGRCYGAALRHMNAWWGGQDQDPETGRSHLWHAATNLAFLISYEARGIGLDNRNKIYGQRIGGNIVGPDPLPEEQVLVSEGL